MFPSPGQRQRAWARGALPPIEVDAFLSPGQGSPSRVSRLANSGLIVKRKTADESVASSVVLQDDDHLFFPLAPYEEWVADFALIAGSNLNITGIKIEVTVPPGATFRAGATVVGENQDGTCDFQTWTAAGGAFFGTTLFLPAGVGRASIYVHLWALNGGSPGNARLQFAQMTSGGTAVALFKGSSLIAHRIDG